MIKGLPTDNEKTTLLEVKSDCGFVDGKCLQQQRNGGNHCCSTCLADVGYIADEVSELPDEYQPYWNSTTGFLTASGCALPVEMRSFACLSYLCPAIHASLSDRHKVKILAKQRAKRLKTYG